MVERVNKVIQKGIQNRLIMNMANNNCPTTPLLTNDNTSSNQLVKMTDGHKLEINMNVLTTLQKSTKSEHSILGFVQKLTGGKIVKGGDAGSDKSQLEHTLWSGKIHIVKVLATEENPVLDPIHLLALYMYTGNLAIFKSTNLALSDWSETNPWNPFVFTLYSAVERLPPYAGEVYRAIDAPFSSKDYAVGTKVQWNNFAICSKEWRNSAELISLKRGTIFIVQSKSGRDVSKYAKSRMDAEILFNPGSTFKVTNLYKPDVIALGQKNIRNVTFAIEEKDIEKADAGKASIIIELGEC
jgi:hypothetical protein